MSLISSLISFSALSPGVYLPIIGTFFFRFVVYLPRVGTFFFRFPYTTWSAGHLYAN
jgi:hypothetical protein